MQKQFDCVKLYFTSPLHLSRGRDYYDEAAKVLHSDSLVSALFVAALQLGAEPQQAEAMLDACRFSSAFPFSGDTYYFPKPLVRLPFPIANVAENKRSKPYKRIQYLDQHWFELLLKGKADEIHQDVHLTQADFLSQKAPENAEIYKSEVVQRVKIAPDQRTDAMPFFTDRLFFAQDAGLFVLVDCQDKANKDLLFSSFRLLGDLGIGTDRSTGNGFFKPCFTTLSLEVPEKAAYQCNLGLYLPQAGELDADDLEQSAWNITKRGGYIAGSGNEDFLRLRKKTVFMFQEGSVFPNKPLGGNRVDLAPKWQGMHAVWREGRPIFLPMQKDEQ